MFKNMKIGDKTIPMLANGATPLRYKLVFKKDIIKELQLAENDYSKVTDSMPELAFIMAKQAEASSGNADLNLLDFNMYMTWMEQFGPMDLVLASDDIIDLYMGNAETSTEPKKKVRGAAKES